jgi:hypothetical protein
MRHLRRDELEAGSMTKDRPPFMFECPCGYSLRAALEFMSQVEISRLMESHIRAVHLGDPNDQTS